MHFPVHRIALLAFLLYALPAFGQAGPQGLYFPGPPMTGSGTATGTFQNLRVGPGSVSIIGGSGNGTDQIKNVCLNGVCPVTAWNAKCNAQQRFDCTINATTVNCPDALFTAADVGKTAEFLYAGATNAGGQNSTLISTIVAAPSGTSVTLANTAVTNASGTFAWGTDDTVPIQNACAGTLPSSVLSFPPGTCLMSDSLRIGNNTPTQCEQIEANNTSLIFAISNHVANGVVINPPNLAGVGYLPVLIKGFLNVDMMNTGLDGVQINSGEPIRIDNLTINRSYRNGLAHVSTGASWIQQEAITHLYVRLAGLHSIYYQSNSNVTGYGFIDNIDYRNLDLECPSLNGMQLVGTPVTGAANNGAGKVRLTVGSTAGYPTYPGGLGCTVMGVAGTTEANGQQYPCAVIDGTHLDLTRVNYAHAYTTGGRVAPSAQLGALISAISQSSSGDGLIFQHSYGFQAELNNCRGALLAGSVGPPANTTDVNSDAIQFLDGTSPHVIEGPGVPSALLSANEKWLFNSPIIEDNSGGAQSIGAEFAGETPAMVVNGLVVTNHQNGGAYSVPTVFIGLNTVNCSNGCGNDISIIGIAGNIGWRQYAGTESLGGGLAVGPVAGGSPPAAGVVNYTGQLQANGTVVADASGNLVNNCAGQVALNGGTPATATVTNTCLGGGFSTVFCTECSGTGALTGGIRCATPTANTLNITGPNGDTNNVCWTRLK